MLAHQASYVKETLARQVISLAPGYWTALSSCPALKEICNSHLTVIFVIQIWFGFAIGLEKQTSKHASDVKKINNRHKQNFEGEANNMQLDREDTRRRN